MARYAAAHSLQKENRFMAGSSLLVLIDDIAAVLDDVSLMTKMAAKKTAGVLGDDLALNAQQVSGVRAEREIPVVWAVAKGSFINKLILVPSALAISAFIPWLVTPLLMVGGAYLCFEALKSSPTSSCTARLRTPPSMRSWSRLWLTLPLIWWRLKRTRSKARSAPTSFFRQKSSPSPSVPWPVRH
jgi:hypothetical protein